MMFGDSLFVQVLHGMRTDDPSYILRISKANGRTIWRQERPTIAQRESPDSYTTPAIVRHGNNLELVITGGDAVTGHDVNTGKELWRADALNPTNDRSLSASSRRRSCTASSSSRRSRERPCW